MPSNVGRIARRDERHALELALAFGLDHQHDVVRSETGQLGRDRLIRSLGHLRVAGRDLDRVRAGRLRAPSTTPAAPTRPVAGIPVPRPAAASPRRRAPPARRRCAADRRGRWPGRRQSSRHFSIACSTRRSTITGGTASAPRADRSAHFDGAQDRGLQRRIVLFDVQRHLHVGDPAAQRPNEPQRHQRGKHGEGQDPEAGHRRRAEPE